MMQKRSLLLFAALLICAVIAPNSRAEEDKQFKRMIKVLDLPDMTANEAHEQKPVAVNKDKFKDRKVMVLDGTASLTADRKKKIRLKEGMLDLWVYMPAGNIQKIPAAGKESPNLFFAGIVESGKEIEALIPVTISAAVRFSLEGNACGATGYIGVMSYKTSMFGVYDFNGWHRLSASFKDRYTAIYIDGILSILVSIDEDARIKSLLPFRTDKMLLSNGIEYEEDSHLATIAIGQVTLYDKYLDYNQMREYHASDKLPIGADMRWQITFDKGKPEAKSTKFKTKGKIEFKTVE